MIRKVLFAFAALCAFAAAVAVAVVALAFALYASLVPSIGPAGAAAVVAGVAAVAAGLAALMAGMRAKRGGGPDNSMLDRAVDLARDHPVIAAGGALVAGLVAIKNPRLVAGLTSAFMAGRATDKADRRRRRW